MQYTKVQYQVYKVNVTNEVTGKNFDHYLIKVEPSELPRIEKSIHKRYPNNILSVSFNIAQDYYRLKRMA